MKKTIFTALSVSAAAMLLCSCVTRVLVDSDVPEQQVAVYDDLTHDFKGNIKAPLADVYKAANIALEQEGYFRCGQIPKDNAWILYARAKKDVRVVISLTQLKKFVEIDISYGEDNLVACQRIYKAILKNLGTYNR